MNTGYLGNFWTYDVDTPVVEPLQAAKFTQTEECSTSGCENCDSNKAKAEESNAALKSVERLRAALIAHSDDLQVENRRLGEDNRRLGNDNKKLRKQLAALQSKFRSLENGGGVPQAAPPDFGGQGAGGGVAASPSPSARASLSAFSVSHGPLRKEGREKDGASGSGGGGGGEAKKKTGNRHMVSPHAVAGTPSPVGDRFGEGASGQGSGYGLCPTVVTLDADDSGLMSRISNRLARVVASVPATAHFDSYGVLPQQVFSKNRDVSRVTSTSVGHLPPLSAEGHPPQERQNLHQQQDQQHIRTEQTRSRKRGRAPSEGFRLLEGPAHGPAVLRAAFLAQLAKMAKPVPYNYRQAAPTALELGSKTRKTQSKALDRIPLIQPEPHKLTSTSGAEPVTSVSWNAPIGIDSGQVRKEKTKDVQPSRSGASARGPSVAVAGSPDIQKTTEQPAANAEATGSGSHRSITRIIGEAHHKDTSVRIEQSSPSSSSITRMTLSLMSGRGQSGSPAKSRATVAASNNPVTLAADIGNSSASSGSGSVPPASDDDASASTAVISHRGDSPSTPRIAITNGEGPGITGGGVVDVARVEAQVGTGAERNEIPARLLTSFSSAKRTKASKRRHASTGKENASGSRRKAHGNVVASAARPRTPPANDTLSITIPSEKNTGDEAKEDTASSLSPDEQDAFDGVGSKWGGEVKGAQDSPEGAAGEKGGAQPAGPDADFRYFRSLLAKAAVPRKERVRTHRENMTEEERRLDNFKKMSKAARQKYKHRLFEAVDQKAVSEGERASSSNSSSSSSSKARHGVAEKQLLSLASAEEGITLRHRHVLECYMCGEVPEDDQKTVFFCGNCPRKACLACQDRRNSASDRAEWKGGRDAYGSYLVDPTCGKCQQSSDDAIPTRRSALGVGVEEYRESVSDGDVRLILARFLGWLQRHDLAHFFVHEVNNEEYPQYRQIVKHPMNFDRMRMRLAAGEYDDRRAGLIRFEEDIDWIVHNCGLFNGDEPAISRCSKILERRAKLYWDTHIDPLQSLQRRGPVEGLWKHEPRRRRSGEMSSKSSSKGGGGGDGGHGGKRGTKRRLIRGASPFSDSTRSGLGGGRGSPDSSSSSTSGLGSRSDNPWILARPSSPDAEETSYQFSVGNTRERSQDRPMERSGIGHFGDEATEARNSRPLDTAFVEENISGAEGLENSQKIRPVDAVTGKSPDFPLVGTEGGGNSVEDRAARDVDERPRGGGAARLCSDSTGTHKGRSEDRIVEQNNGEDVARRDAGDPDARLDRPAGVAETQTLDD